MVQNRGYATYHQLNSRNLLAGVRSGHCEWEKSDLGPSPAVEHSDLSFWHQPNPPCCQDVDGCWCYGPFWPWTGRWTLHQAHTSLMMLWKASGSDWGSPNHNSMESTCRYNVKKKSSEFTMGSQRITWFQTVNRHSQITKKGVGEGGLFSRTGKMVLLLLWCL